MIKLIHGDSLTHLVSMATSSVDVCITDPPYGLTFLDKGKFDKLDEESAPGGGAFSGGNGGGMAFSKNQNAETTKFLLPFFQETYRVLKPGAFCISFSQGRLLLGVLLALDQAGFEVREQFYWRKPSALPNQQSPSKKNSKIKVETNRVILGPGKIVEPFVVAQKPKEGSYAENFLKWGTGLVDRIETTSTVFDCKSASKIEKGGLTHPTIKPIELMQRIVRCFSKPGDLILDPFSGSGSTGAAAILEGRDYLGIELSELFHSESSKRLKELARGMKST